MRVGLYMAKSSDKYSGANPFKALYPISKILKSILKLSGISVVYMHMYVRRQKLKSMIRRF